MKYQALRGTKDILPTETGIWHFVEKNIHEVFQSFGFNEIRTPIIEQTELFTRSIGDGTDIVSKEMYTFTDKGDRSITLRPEATAAVVRAAIEHNLLKQSPETKVYYLGPIFRYERPQAGRFRQFHQAGVEFFGPKSPYADAEVIITGFNLFKKLGIKTLQVNINILGCEEDTKPYTDKLSKYFHSQLDNLCPNCNERYKNNKIMRMLDCKDEKCSAIFKSAPKAKDFLCATCKTHLNIVVDALKIAGIDAVMDNRLVRGLDYYTGIVFEIVSNDLGAQNAVCGGGRYDNLVHDLGGDKIPAVGMAIGLERLISIMKLQGEDLFRTKNPDVYIAWVGDEALKKAYSFSEILRKNDKSVVMEYSARSLKSHFKKADSTGASFVLIIGEEEIEKKLYQLKDMASGDQIEVSEDQLFDKLR